MSLLVVGSVALDSVETPTEKRDNVLGGSAVFFSYAASYFTDVRLVGVVGEVNGNAIGACWMRLLPEGVGLASIDAATPQLGIALELLGEARIEVQHVDAT